MQKKVYLALGSNLNNPQKNVTLAFKKISELKLVTDCQLSPLYHTSAVSDIPQEDYINAVCSLWTNCDVWQLKDQLEQIEQILGKIPKPKNYPRIIDIDILLYGDDFINAPNLQIPHPRMLERLFVLKPLSDLTMEIRYPLSAERCKFINLQQHLENFHNQHQETVRKI